MRAAGEGGALQGAAETTPVGEGSLETRPGQEGHRVRVVEGRVLSNTTALRKPGKHGWNHSAPKKGPVRDRRPGPAQPV